MSFLTDDTDFSGTSGDFSSGFPSLGLSPSCPSDLSSSHLSSGLSPSHLSSGLTNCIILDSYQALQYHFYFIADIVGDPCQDLQYYVCFGSSCDARNILNFDIGQPTYLNFNVGQPANLSFDIGQPANLNFDLDVGQPADLNFDLDIGQSADLDIGQPTNLNFDLDIGQPADLNFDLNIGQSANLNIGQLNIMFVLTFPNRNFNSNPTMQVAPLVVIRQLSVLVLLSGL
ncbi:hypothetical protein BC936DRAFT_142043 [Jimgerdemannia flammicorona]|uniref:Uncharacterized protein n=1 Tax=Jimgerdemannia flammicorona TaxID=994334 RepID=A0A433A1B0_9FUNG|nr:hypothetical protein BC936DRAFT_142043 [Jimgerdemannia flammicorona]